MTMPVDRQGVAAPRDDIVSCWSCKGPVAARAPFCHTCGAVQPPRQADHFARLGLAPSFDLDPATLDRQYFGLQRSLHPDRFAVKTARERAIAESQAVSLNQAYETLKDPLRRAAYLLELRGADNGESRTIDDPELLIEAMENREALQEAEGPAAVDALAARADNGVARCIADLSASFAQGDLQTAGRLVHRLKYLRKFLDEARVRKSALAEAGS